ncbi:hypothetical protein HJ590_02350 [Naumannella sp. ID2617S]|nr:hypothetical protein [Naumannella sp. ID2617S]
MDTEIAQLQHQRASLPEHARIASMLADRKRLLADYTRAETEVSDLTRDQSRAEADLEPVRARKVRDQQRIDSGSVSDPKSLQGLIDEVQHLTRRISDLEDAELEVMEQLEKATATFEELQARRGELETEIRALMKTRDAQVAELDTKLGHADTERRALAEKLPQPLLAAYEKLRANHGGLGAAELRHGRCSGCRLDVNAADLRAFAAAPADEVLRCEECGRILVRTAESGL